MPIVELEFPAKTIRKWNSVVGGWAIVPYAHSTYQYSSCTAKMFCLPPKLSSWWLMVCKIIALLIDGHYFFFANVIGQQNEVDEMLNIRKIAASCYSIIPHPSETAQSFGILWILRISNGILPTSGNCLSPESRAIMQRLQPTFRRSLFWRAEQ